MPEGAKLPPTDWTHSEATGTAAAMSRQERRPQAHLPQKPSWIRRTLSDIVSAMKRHPKRVAGGVALGVALSQTPVPGVTADITRNVANSAASAVDAGVKLWNEGEERDAQPEQTAPPILVFNGEFDVSSQIVQGFHVTEFGGTKVSGDIPYYRVPLGIIEHDSNGTFLVVQGIDTEGKAINLRVPCDPAGKYGEGPAGGAIVGKEGEVISSADATMPDGSHAALSSLSNAMPGTGPLPTPRP